MENNNDDERKIAKVNRPPKAKGIIIPLEEKNDKNSTIQVTGRL